ncbi:hypothetical protein U1Q18_043904 [Sarracenia purpurea var. burkii]
MKRSRLVVPKKRKSTGPGKKRRSIGFGKEFVGEERRLTTLKEEESTALEKNWFHERRPKRSTLNQRRCILTMPLIGHEIMAVFCNPTVERKVKHLERPSIFGSIFGVAAGFVVGKEGPMVHTGSCIANLLGQGGSRKYHLTWKWLRYFKNDRDRRDLITCGAAAGVAAAFRAPVGGVLFALEEAASWWRSALLWRTFFTTAVVAVVLRSLIEFCRSGKCGLFGQGGLIMFDVNSAVPTYSIPDLLTIMLLGIIGGIFGSLYNYLVDKVLRTYSIINEYVVISPLVIIRLQLARAIECHHSQLPEFNCK